jgi:hypothetical protein
MQLLVGNHQIFIRCHGSSSKLSFTWCKFYLTLCIYCIKQLITYLKRQPWKTRYPNVNLGSASVLWLGLGIFFVLDLVLLLSVKEKSLQFHLYFVYNLYYTCIIFVLILEDSQSEQYSVFWLNTFEHEYTPSDHKAS